MARIRTIKPEFPQSESMGRVSRDARLLFIMMWTIADDAGRLRAASRMLASLLFPFDDDAPALIEGWLAELEDEGCIRRYVAGGTTYAEIVKWLEHQKIDRPSKSRLPAFDEGSREFAKDREGSCTDLGPRTMDLGPIPPSEDAAASSPSQNEEVEVAEMAPGAAVVRGRAEQPDLSDQKVQLYDRGREVLGESAGGQITKLLRAQDGSIPKARAIIETASTRANPAEYVAAVIHGKAREPDSVEARTKWAV